MKRKIGISLIIILNLALLFVMGGLTIASYGIITGSAGRIHAENFTKEVTNEILIRLSYIVNFVAALNYWILRKVVYNKNSFRMTFILFMLSLIIYTPFLLSQRTSFLIRQSEPDLLNHYYDRFEIQKAQILTLSDTIDVANLNDFTNEFWRAERVGPLKYGKTMKIILNNKNGQIDTIQTSGQIFGPFKGEYFIADINLIADYLKYYNK